MANVYFTDVGLTGRCVTSQTPEQTGMLHLQLPQESQGHLLSLR